MDNYYNYLFTEVKVASMTEDELSRYMEEKLVTEGTDYNKIITSRYVILDIK